MRCHITKLITKLTDNLEKQIQILGCIFLSNVSHDGQGDIEKVLFGQEVQQDEWKYHDEHVLVPFLLIKRSQIIVLLV